MPVQRNWGDGGATSSSSTSSSVIIGSTGRHSHDFMMQKRSKMKFPSSMSLDETDSSDDSTYSSQYQSDANSTPRTGTSHTLPRHLPTTHRSSVTSNGATGGSSVVKVKSMSDYEAEILQMREEMQQLQCKLVEAELRLNTTNQREVEAKEVVDKLRKEEDKLRREQMDMSSEDPIADKERMILMQQKKIAALDAANKRLLEELTRMSQVTTTPASTTKVSVTTNPPTTVGGLNVTSINTSSNTVSHDRRVSSSSTSSNKSITVITNGEATVTASAATSSAAPPNSHAKSNSMTQETPKTVDELLDSLHSTSI